MNRELILDYVRSEYNTEAEYPWKSDPDSAVLRHHRNRKWYGLIMRLTGNKIGLQSEESIDVINLKCDPEMIPILCQSPGFYPAFHMNKQHWVTIVLDGTVTENKLLDFLDLSYEMTK